MNIELQLKLWEDFPSLYIQEYEGKIKRTYFEIQDGWFDLIYDLSSKINQMLENYKRIYKDDGHIMFSVDQVKEKYGGLRFYTIFSSEEINNLIQEYESKSKTICEVCGKPGNLIKDHWYSTLCEEHT